MKSHYKTIIFWSVCFLYLVVSLSFVASKEASEYCVELDLRIQGNAQNYFVDKHDILEIIKEHNGVILGQKNGTINVRAIEKTLDAHSFIKNAEVYKEAYGKIIVEIEQRNPIVRVIDKNGVNFYIDEQGYIMPVSSKFTARVPIANGNLSVNWDKLKNKYLGKLMLTSDSLEASQVANLYQLMAYIHNDTFWQKQIQQVYLNKDAEVEIIPRVGAHIILLGDMHNFEKKFRNLKAVYDKAFRKIGWNQYRTINLKFENQVICTKRTP